MRLYAVHDKKARTLVQFAVDRSDVTASRSFAEAVLDPKSQWNKYPEDFELVVLCDVSQEYTGEFDGHVMVAPVEMSVVLTAEQAVANDRKRADLHKQLELLEGV